MQPGQIVIPCKFRAAGQGGAGGVQCNARAATEHLVLHHHVLCWLPLTWSPSISHVYKVSSSPESLYAVWAVLELTRSIGYSQTAPRHEKPLEAGQVLALLPGRGRTYKQDDSFAHCLHWNAGTGIFLHPGTLGPHLLWGLSPLAEKIPSL